MIDSPRSDYSLPDAN